MAEDKRIPSISSDIQEEMKKLCRKATAAHDLKPEVSEELYGHLEDKLLGYLSGQERVTEADAMILVREHFGKPEELKRMLEALRDEDTVPLSRRIVSAAVATMAIHVACACIVPFLKLGISRLAINVGYRDAILLAFPPALVSIGAVAVLCIVLQRWQRTLDQGGSPWFVRWSIPAIGGLVAGMLVVSAIIRIAVIPVSVWSAGYRFSENQHALMWAMTMLSFCSLGVQCIIWFWWCARSPSRWIRLTLSVAGAWVIYNLVLVMAEPQPRWTFPEGDPMRGVLSIGWGPPSAYHLALAGMMAIVAAVAVIVSIMYREGKKFIRVRMA